MKRLWLLLILVTAASSLAAGDLWYNAYDQGVRAFHAGNYPAAGRLLKEALKSQPMQGRRIKTYGTGFIRYVPEYYLGLIDIRLGHYESGRKQLERVRDAKLIIKSDAEFSELQQNLKLAEEKLVPEVRAEKQPEKTDPEKATPSPEPLQVEPSLIPESKMPQDEPGPAEAKEREDKEQQGPAPVKQPENEPIPQTQKATTVASPPLPEPAPRGEREALIAYYSGDYEEAIALFNQLPEKDTSAKIQFYLGCSCAALALIDAEREQQLLKEAGQHFTRCRQLNPQFRAEKRYISPRIVQLYQNDGVAETINK